MPISDEEHVSEQPMRRMLCPGPALPGHTLQQDKEHLTWIIDQTLVPCTQPEYFCLKELLEHANNRVSFAQLAVYLRETGVGEGAEQKSERIRMRHLISNLRSKIWMLGMDIVSLRDIGYILLLDSSKETIHHHDEHAS